MSMRRRLGSWRIERTTLLRRECSAPAHALRRRAISLAPRELFRPRWPRDAGAASQSGCPGGPEPRGRPA
eukprot:2873677-Pyramimonas_sp.AAC.1